MNKFTPIKSFKMKKVLNPDIWEDDVLKQEIRKQLKKIAEDFFDGLNFSRVKLSDIVLVGSLANYNWSKYSDIDLHLVFDFEKVNEDIELVRNYLDLSDKIWNQLHDIKIYGYDVEIYCQNILDNPVSSGQYSILKNKWMIHPDKEKVIIDEALIKRKAEAIMDFIDNLEDELGEAFDYQLIYSKYQYIWSKIKEGRLAGLSREGEYSVENLVFKLLRRNGYISKLLDIRKKSYDKQFK